MSNTEHIFIEIDDILEEKIKMARYLVNPNDMKALITQVFKMTDGNYTVEEIKNKINILTFKLTKGE